MSPIDRPWLFITPRLQPVFRERLRVDRRTSLTGRCARQRDSWPWVQCTPPPASGGRDG
jgi:hypothetical protein